MYVVKGRFVCSFAHARVVIKQRKGIWDPERGEPENMTSTWGPGSIVDAAAVYIQILGS